MIDHLKYATISQIYVRDMKFFEDFTSQEERIAFCRELGITYLPARDRINAYQLTPDAFTKVQPAPELCCNPYDRIFENETLMKFKEGSHDEVLFVMEKDRIKGVVHVTDYNSEYLFFEFYKLIHRFERGLRDFLVQRGEGNDTFLEWVQQRADGGVDQQHWRNRQRKLLPDNEKTRAWTENVRRDCRPFQTFYFGELVDFAESKGHLSTSNGSRWSKLNGLRNLICHSSDLATKTASADEFPLYSIESLERFISSAQVFFEAYEELAELLQGRS